MYRKEGVKRAKERRKEKQGGVKTFSELACPLTSAYVCLCGHGVRAHPASSAAIKLPFPTPRSEVTPKRPELKRKVMGPTNERKRESCYLGYSPIDGPETAVLITVCTMNIHQYDHCHFLNPMSQVAYQPAKHIHTYHHIEVILPTSAISKISVTESEVMIGVEDSMQRPGASQLNARNPS